MTDFLACSYCGFPVANLMEEGKKKSYKQHCPCYSKTAYCDKVCQKKDWRKHKKSCKHQLLQVCLGFPDELIKKVCHFAADD